MCLCAFVAVPAWSSADILILAPHPDDDVLTAAGVIYRAQRNGVPVRIVYMTNGDASGGDVVRGLARQAEAVNAVNHLGLSEDSLIFLGYPDGYLAPIAQSYTTESSVFQTASGQSSTYGNRGLGRVDYHTYRFGAPAPYNRPNILRDLADILQTYQPDHIFTTAEFDQHADHSTTYQLLGLALTQAAVAVPGYNPTIHRTPVWPRWRNALDPTSYVAEGPNLTGTGLLWSQRESLDVPLEMQSLAFQANPKYLAIGEHRSQSGPISYGAFVHKDEVFWVTQRVGTNRPPQVSAGFDQTVPEGVQVQLDGSASSDPNEDALTFLWRQVAGPVVTLAAPNAARPTFVAPTGLSESETLVFELTVSDGVVVSVPDSVSVVVRSPLDVQFGNNVALLAQATASSEAVETGSLAASAIDGIRDGYPGVESNEWATVRQHEGAWIRLTWTDPVTVGRVVLFDRPNTDDHITAATLRFSDGSVLTLGALDNWGRSSIFTFSPRTTTSIELTVTAVGARTYNIGLSEFEVYEQLGNHIPVANAGQDRVVGENVVVVLDGSASLDSDGDFLRFSWRQTSGMTVALSDSAGVTPSFVSPSGLRANENLSFELVVTDGAAESAPHAVHVSVIATNPNYRPVASAGSDQTVAPGAVVQLDGSASMDQNGDALTYRWSQVSGRRVILSGASLVRPTFTAPFGSLNTESVTFRLVVNDGLVDSAAASVTVTVVAPPQPGVNIAGSAAALASSESVNTTQLAVKAIDGIADGYPRDPAREWATAAQRTGAWIQLTWSEPQTIDRVVLYDRPNSGDQVTAATLQFSDGSSVVVGSLPNNGTPADVRFLSRVTTTVRVLVTAVSSSTQNVGLSEIAVYGNSWTPPPNRAPVANAGADQLVNQGVTVQLNGDASTDADLNALTYLWSQTSGTPVVLSDPTAVRPSFVAPGGLSADSVLTFALVVNDGEYNSAADMVQVTVSATPLSFNIAGLSSVTASSENTRSGQRAVKAVDGVADGYPGDYTKEWATAGQRAGAWIQLAWAEPRTIHRIVLNDRPNTGDQILGASLEFSDGTTITVGTLPNNGAPATFDFAPKTVTTVRLVVTAVSGSTGNVGLSEIAVYSH